MNLSIRNINSVFLRIRMMSLLLICVGCTIPPHTDIQSIKANDYNGNPKRILVNLRADTASTIIGDGFTKKFLEYAQNCGINAKSTFDSNIRLSYKDWATFMLMPEEQREKTYAETKAEFVKEFNPDAILDIVNMSSLHTTISINGLPADTTLSGYGYDVTLLDSITNKKIWRAIVNLNLGKSYSNRDAKEFGILVAKDVINRMKADGFFQSCSSIN